MAYTYVCSEDGQTIVSEVALDYLDGEARWTRTGSAGSGSSKHDGEASEGEGGHPKPRNKAEWVALAATTLDQPAGELEKLTIAEIQELLD